MALDKVKDDMLQDNLVFPGSTTQFPSITTTQRDALSGVQPGTIIYNSTVGKLQQYDGNNAWATIDSPPVITSITYPTESGAVLTALDATGSSDAAQTLIINGSNFTSTVTVEILVSGTYASFASSTSVNGARTQITCTGVTKRAAADGYVLKVTNTTGLDASTTVNFSADAGFTTAANLGTVLAGQILNKSIAFTGTRLSQGATAKPDWMTVTGASHSGSDDNGAGDTTFSTPGSPAVLGGTIAAPASNNTQTHTFSIIVRDAENQTFNRDFSLIAATAPTGGTITEPGSYTGGGYRSHKFVYNTSSTTDQAFNVYGDIVADIFMIAGGGGGGQYYGGGGGAGGVRIVTGQTLTAGLYNIRVGGGGNGGTTSDAQGNNGFNTSLANSGGGTSITIVATGGGGGGGNGNNPADYGGTNGGSGGGAKGGRTGGTVAGTGINDGGTFGTLTYQGHNGGTPTPDNNSHAAGGGGAGSGGGGGSNNYNGGAGITRSGANNWIDGTTGTTVGLHQFGGGGGGQGSGGEGSASHGGGAGNGNSSGNSGAAHSGAGGGAGNAGGGGGSGIVVIRYAV